MPSVPVPAGAAAPRDPEFGPLPDAGTPHRFFALGGRPILQTRTRTGGADLLALDPATGAFLPARQLWPRLSAGSIDLDEIDETAFRALGRRWRAQAMAHRVAAPLVWHATGDGEYPLRAHHAGHEAVIRVNDCPAEPLYSVIVAAQSVGELEDWPAAWTKSPASERGIDSGA